MFDWLQIIKRYWPAIVLSLALVLILDGTISSLVTCHPPPNGPSASQNSNENCTVFNGPLISLIRNIGTFFETHDKGIIAAFTVILAVSTIGLWLATIGLYKSGERQIRTSRQVSAMQARLARQQFKLAKETADRQAKEIQAQLKIAGDSLEFTHRARVSILEASVQRQFVMERGGKREFLRISYILQNSGNFPATRISESFADTCGPEWAPPTKQRIKIAPQMEEIGLIIAPQESLVRSREVPDKPPDFYEKAAGAETFYIRIGIICVYVDGFNKERTTWKWFEWTQNRDPSRGWYYRECAARQD